MTKESARAERGTFLESHTKMKSRPEGSSSRRKTNKRKEENNTGTNCVQEKELKHAERESGW